MNALIELRKLQHLVLLAEELNFSRAAEKANLSQTAFSRSIQALEDESGLHLFDRGTRTVKITASGRHLLAKARHLVTQANDLSRELQFIAHGDVGELNFGVGPLAVHSVVREILREFRQQKPQLRLNIEISHWEKLRQFLEEEKIEFFVAYPGTLMVDPRFKVTLLRPQASSIYCRAGHPLLLQTLPPHPAQLPNFRWAALHFEEEIAKVLRPLCNMAPADPLPIGLNCDNLDLLRDATMDSDLLLFTGSAWLHPELASGVLVDLGAQLRPVLPEWAFQLDSAVVQLAHRTPSPAAQNLMDRLQKGISATHATHTRLAR